MMLFYLGTHSPGWLADSEIPLFVSRRRLAMLDRLPRARTHWVLDSGGFSELRAGSWWRSTRSPYPMRVGEYAAEILRYEREIGFMDWAAPMDWMCEPEMIWRHGMGIAHHQAATLKSFLQLREIVGPLVAPVVQGWTIGDYLRSWELYERAGVDLAAERIVGVGSVCRRGQDSEIVRILDRLANDGLLIHAFGVRSSAMARVADTVISSDSLAWSYAARREQERPGWKPDHPHPRGGFSCANCRVYAERWYRTQLDHLAPLRLSYRLPDVYRRAQRL